MFWTRAHLIIGALGLVGAVCIAVTILWLRPFGPSAIGSPEEQILGAWEISAANEGNAGSGELGSDIGFVVEKDGTHNMRTYQSSEGTLSALVRMDQWQLVLGDTPTLEIRRYGASVSDDALHSYRITFISSDAFEITELSSVADGDSASPRVFRYERIRTAQKEASVVMVRTSEENELACDRLFSDEGQDPYILLPITCMVSISTSTAPVAFTISESGNFKVTRGADVLFETDRTDDDDAHFVAWDGPFFSPTSIILRDVTYDGYLDIGVETARGAYNQSYDYYAYNPATKKYGDTPVISEIVNPEFDVASRTITSFSKGRGVGDIYVLDKYVWESGRYVETYRETQDFASDNEDAGYIRIIEERRGHDLVVTSRKKIPAEQVWNSM